MTFTFTGIFSKLRKRSGLLLQQIELFIQWFDYSTKLSNFVELTVEGE